MKAIKNYIVYLLIAGVVAVTINMLRPTYGFFILLENHQYKEVLEREYYETGFGKHFGRVEKRFNTEAKYIGVLFAGILILINPLVSFGRRKSEKDFLDEVNRNENSLK